MRSDAALSAARRAPLERVACCGAAVLLAALIGGATSAQAQVASASSVAAPAAALPTVAPAQTVETLHTTLIDVMKHGKELGCSGRNKKLSATLDNSFDLPFMTQRLLRRHWDTLTPAQRDAFLAAVRENVSMTYASQFSQFSGQAFTTLGTQEMPNGDRVVHTSLKPPTGADVTLDYLMRANNGQWRIINIIAQGVSDMAIRSAQYDQIFNKDGVDGLINALKQQTAQIAKTC